jgi:hypothetical protein
MKTYQKICTSCGKAFIAYKINAKTRSINCRVALHYIKNCNNKGVERLTSEKQLNNYIYNDEKCSTPLNEKNPIYNNFGVERSTSLNYGGYLEGFNYKYYNRFEHDTIGGILRNRMKAFLKFGYDNYFIKENKEEQYLVDLKYNERIYLLVAFYELAEPDFETFYSHMGHNSRNFLFLETLLEFPTRGKLTNVIKIYVNEDMFEEFFNNQQRHDRYKYIPLEPQEGSRIYYNQNSDRWLIRRTQ